MTMMMEQFQAQTNDSRNGRLPSRHNLLRQRRRCRRSATTTAISPSRHNLLRKRRRCRRSATTTAISDKTTPPATTTTTTRSKMILLLLVATAAATVLTSQPEVVDALPPSFGTSHHHSHAPIELDVESPLLMDLDSSERSSCEDYHASLLESGYAGTIDAVGRDFYVAEYGYQMILNSSLVEDDDLVVSTARTTAAGRNNDGGSTSNSNSNSITFHQPKSFGEVDENSLQNIVFQIEFEIASYMLKESSAFDNAPCNTNNNNNRYRRRRNLVYQRRRQQQQQQQQERQQNGSSTRRRTAEEIVNVGLTIGPTDEIRGPCPTEPSDPELVCYEVLGSFQVYITTAATESTTRSEIGTVSENNDTPSDVAAAITAAEEEILNELKSGMDDGQMNNAHPSIVGLTYVNPEDLSSSSSSTTTDDENSNTNDGGGSGSGNDGGSAAGQDGTTVDSSTTGDENPTTDRIAPPMTTTFIVVATVGSFLLVCGFIFLRRRRADSSNGDNIRTRRNSRMPSHSSSNNNNNNNNDALNTSNVSSLNCIRGGHDAVVDDAYQ
eukprot:CAMPEP_0113518936 /NCGR_PEP_ID=MMETSP0014_2-20120614/43248_1 /TAXON_ID=2857 /ORGANISM="Nitzschia sp." /LENGTH=551 /DNA_ID=CAMNT_0000416613 /DNA_START=133 /DNA_END=1785 /DNA_ORIENTATION=+ /assembly_acc=CAM_ASM_000159